jgi:hypothetical protein
LNEAKRLNKSVHGEPVEPLERLSLRTNDAFYAYLELINKQLAGVRPAAPGITEVRLQSSGSESVILAEAGIQKPLDFMDSESR